MLDAITKQLLEAEDVKQVLIHTVANLNLLADYQQREIETLKQKLNADIPEKERGYNIPTFSRFIPIITN